jgi:hypothetical protein
MAETARAARRYPELVNLDEPRARNGRNNKLRDTFLGFNRYGLLAKVNQEHFQLAAVIGVDRTGGIHQRETFFERAATSGPHLPFKPGWYFNCNSSGDGGTGERLKHQRFVERGTQVNSRGVLALIARQGSTQTLNFDDGNNQWPGPSILWRVNGRLRRDQSVRAGVSASR